MSDREHIEIKTTSTVVCSSKQFVIDWMPFFFYSQKEQIFIHSLSKSETSALFRDIDAVRTEILISG